MEPILARITDRLARTNPHDLVHRIAKETQAIIMGGLAASDLESPARGSEFLLSSMLRAGAEDDQPLDDEGWRRLLEDVHEVYRLYMLMHFPPPDPDVPFPDDPARLTEVTLVAFTDYHNTGLLATTEQRGARLQRFYGPLDDVLRDAIGYDVEEILDAIKHVEETWGRQFWQISQKYNRLQATFAGRFAHLGIILNPLTSATHPVRNEIRAAGSAASVVAEMAELSEELEKTKRRQFRVPKDDLEPGAAPPATSWLLDNLATNRDDETTVTYPTGVLPTERTPLLDLSEDHYSIVHPGHLYPAVGFHLEDVVRDAGARDRALRTRDKALERAVEDVVETFLVGSQGDAEAEAWWSVCEDPNGQHEHDGLVRVGDSFIILEDKASPLSEVFRDPEKAYERIKGDFRAKTGPQGAYDQARNLFEKLSDPTGTTLYDKDGNIVLETAEAAEEVLIVCVVDQSYRAIGTHYEFLLQREHGDPPPFIIPFEDLETLLAGFRQLGRTTDDLLVFLQEQVEVSRSISASDHLDTATIFLARGTLTFIPKLREEDKPHRFIVWPTFSHLFDLLHRGEEQAAKEMLEDLAESVDIQDGHNLFRDQIRGGLLSLPGGPNPWRDAASEDPCPCRSGWSFGECHGPIFNPDIDA